MEDKVVAEISFEGRRLFVAQSAKSLISVGGFSLGVVCEINLFIYVVTVRRCFVQDDFWCGDPIIRRDDVEKADQLMRKEITYGY
jgi:hypothetical protein